MFHNRAHTWIAGILIFVYVCVQSWCIQQLTINYDEGLFAYYGATLLKMQGNKDIVKFDSKLPITALNMLPRAAEQILHPGLQKLDSYTDIIRGRYISLLATILLALVVYKWGLLLYGGKGALYSFIIFLLCPNFLAHGIFVSSDIYACLFMTAGFFFLWRFTRTGQNRHFIFASMAVALAEISKFSMVHLLILFPLLLLAWYFFDTARPAGKKPPFKKIIYLLVIFGIINWFVISAAHLFYGMFIPFNAYQFRSTTFQHLQAALHGIGNYLPVPLPSSYVKSMDVVMYFDQLGGGAPDSLNGPPYILGHSSANGFWYYYFVVLLYKLPLSILLLLAATLVLYFRKAARKTFVQHEMYLLIPVCYFLIYMDFFYSTQLGIRHMMIILPLLYVFTGFFFQQVSTAAGKYFSYSMVAYQLISVGLYFPHFLPYTNELMADKKMAFKKIADTNLCYGEGGKFLFQYLQKNPGAKYMPATISSGRVVMEVNEMLNLDIATMGKYDWVKGLVPVDHIHSQYLVFDISAEVADSLQKKSF